MNQASIFAEYMNKIWNDEVFDIRDANIIARIQEAQPFKQVSRDGHKGAIWVFLDKSEIFIAKDGNMLQFEVAAQ